jgi:hypothetical protein
MILLFFYDVQLLLKISYSDFLGYMLFFDCFAFLSTKSKLAIKS